MKIKKIISQQTVIAALKRDNAALRVSLATGGREHFTGYSRYDQMVDKTREYIRKNPRLWQAFVAKTFAYIRAGSRRESVARTFAEVRSDPTLPCETGEFKISNTYQPYFVRLFAEQFPAFDAFYVQHDMPTKYRPAHVRPDKGPKDFPALPPEGLKL